MDRILTRAEEFLLLAVLKLGDNAYPVSIFDEIGKATGSSWTLGAIYFPLQRLEEKGLLTSVLGDPTSERGGKSRRYYRITGSGLEALSAARRAQDNMWHGVEWARTK
ncbi:MAG: PadR family transcriptional regulator [Candidatus Aminicenantes bacterium]|jgi:PadR family transcriptional regulator PadR|nr:PadR family transcriptional regulator [Candidatus Aminicenantes bacterium]MCJ7485427.1 PadR family transcriptional regulator [Candidatus Aminicenantes bacterium]TFG57875.1 MAG: PadR family transcriptional regulator [Candidatus Aminicenantes bacterium]